MKRIKEFDDALKEQEIYEKFVEYSFVPTPGTLTGLFFSILGTLFLNEMHMRLGFFLLGIFILLLNYFGYRDVYWRRIKWQDN